MVKKLLHTRYRVTDLEKTVAFYRDVLGLAGNAAAHFRPRFAIGFLQGAGQRRGNRNL